MKHPASKICLSLYLGSALYRNTDYESRNKIIANSLPQKRSAICWFVNYNI